jgi:DHA2 family multidrug resistance protein
MMKPLYFKEWITDWHWGTRIALLLMLLSSLSQLGMFVMTQNYMVAYLGAQPEDISFAIMCTYAGIITVIPLQFRFFRYFEPRSYLLASLISAIILNFSCVFCKEIEIFLVIRFFQGILTGNVLVFTLLLIFTRIDHDRVKLVAPAVFYGAILSNIVIVGAVAGFVVESTDWKATYYYLIGSQLMTVVVVLLMLRRSTKHRRYPLYQLDWAGAIIFGCTALAVAYTIIYGSKYYWFGDARIVYSSIFALTGCVLFLYRQYLVRRPVIYLSVFRSKRFLGAICLLAIYYGSKDSVNLIYNYASGVLKWSTLQVIGLGVCNLFGMIVLLVFSILMMLVNKLTTRTVLLVGFGLMAVFNVWMSFLLTPDLSFSDLIFPVMLQGASSGLLFVPIMIYLLGSAGANTGTSGLIIGACTRFIATTNSFAGFYNLQLYFNQHFKERFLSDLIAERPQTIERMAFYKGFYTSNGFSPDQVSVLVTSSIGQQVNQQSQLMGYRAVFMFFGVLLSVITILILLMPFFMGILGYCRENIRLFIAERMSKGKQTSVGEVA